MAGRGRVHAVAAAQGGGACTGPGRGWPGGFAGQRPMAPGWSAGAGCPPPAHARAGGGRPKRPGARTPGPGAHRRGSGAPARVRSGSSRGESTPGPASSCPRTGVGIRGQDRQHLPEMRRASGCPSAACRRSTGPSTVTLTTQTTRAGRVTRAPRPGGGRGRKPSDGPAPVTPSRRRRTGPRALPGLRPSLTCGWRPSIPVAARSRA